MSTAEVLSAVSAEKQRSDCFHLCIQFFDRASSEQNTKQQRASAKAAVMIHKGRTNA